MVEYLLMVNWVFGSILLGPTKQLYIGAIAQLSNFSMEGRKCLL